jgi:hypothetical protein
MIFLIILWVAGIVLVIDSLLESWALRRDIKRTEALLDKAIKLMRDDSCKKD